ncbi:Winged helix DNA-binding domain-containing protein [Amycolatopsis arida]|uniref:Winged helix DNA-binding domain-containing protein n=1 Tax=Amycolatopsis arida TaxID=587909 RepID=A0A1I5WCS4_9PSEU|nr:winged helix DNA-binding domain-containing protein [Amycolatopsis arida]TDX92220.1 winged helix DNA-binding protein [Amycolatopsis arida]SFQ17520.1 Winged helix DNA-binding domain-containing protein [Amycolatopsis arida]
MLEVDRQQVMAYRVATQGLLRTASDPAALRVFDLGVQDSTRDTALLALVARSRASASLVGDSRFTLAWTHRGAPHFHRSAELPGLAAALLPLDDADARARMAWRRRDVEQAGMPVTEAIRVTAGAIREVATAPMTKGAVSGAISPRLPEGLVRWCRPCGVTHVHEQLMRLSALPAGVGLVAGASPATLMPLDGVPGVPASPDLAGATRIVRHYLALHGPATAADTAGFVGTTGKVVERSLWPDDLVEVRVDGRRAFLPAEDADRLTSPPEPAAVRLLPPWDPLLQARDRAVLVPDRAHHKEVWKILGNPGALLAGGEIAGTWRAKVSGHRLALTVSPLWPLSPAVRAAVSEEAERVAAARGLGLGSVTWK